jgi:hypothetical protein
VITQTVATDAQLVANGLKSALAALSSVTGKDTSAIQTEITNVVAGLETVVAGIQTNLAKPVIAQVAADWSVAVKAVQPILSSLPAAVVSVINAVTTLLPYITAATGLVGAEEASASANSSMTPDEARVVLAAT